MPKGTMTFLLDSGQIFKECVNLAEVHHEPALVRLEKIATARLALLAKSGRIVRLKVTGSRMKKVDWRGTGGEWASPRYRLNYTPTQWTLPVHFWRGVPREIYFREQLTDAGKNAVVNYGKAFIESGCYTIRRGEERRPITELRVWDMGHFNWKKDKPATKKKLIKLMGRLEGEKAWTLVRELQDRRAGVMSP